MAPSSGPFFERRDFCVVIGEGAAALVRQVAALTSTVAMLSRQLRLNPVQNISSEATEQTREKGTKPDPLIGGFDRAAGRGLQVLDRDRAAGRPPRRDREPDREDAARAPSQQAVRRGRSDPDLPLPGALGAADAAAVSSPAASNVKLLFVGERALGGREFGAQGNHRRRQRLRIGIIRSRPLAARSNPGADRRRIAVVERAQLSFQAVIFGNHSEPAHRLGSDFDLGACPIEGGDRFGQALPCRVERGLGGASSTLT
jgi:hypothetical protein